MAGEMAGRRIDEAQDRDDGHGRARDDTGKIEEAERKAGQRRDIRPVGDRHAHRPPHHHDRRAEHDEPAKAGSSKSIVFYFLLRCLIKIGAVYRLYQFLGRLSNGGIHLI